MPILDNFENSIPEDFGKVNPKVTEALKQMLEDPEFNHIMERLKYMEDNGI